MNGASSGGAAPAPPLQPGAGGGLAAVLFDMDGLLVDSEPLWYEAERRIMERMGGDWTPADQEHLIGGALDNSVGYMIAKAERPAAPAVVAGWLVDNMAVLTRERGVPFKPGAERLLAEVAAAGIASALVTSSERVIMEVVLEVTGLAFTVTVCGEDVSRRKPDPEPYLRAARLLGAEPRHCVALDDSPTGVAAAEAAGCVVVAVPSVPIPPRPGRVTVPSLTGLDLTVLRELVAG